MEKCLAFVLGGGGSMRGALSNLPIEPAMRIGATEIIALDLSDRASLFVNIYGLNQYLVKLIFAATKRLTCLEIELAEAQGVPVHRLELRSSYPIPIWDFSKYRELIEIGYGIASLQIYCWLKAGETRLAFPDLITDNQATWEFA